MPSYVLTPVRRAAYAALFDFRSQFVKAARQILTAGGIEASGPGDGIAKIKRYATSVDFERGAATGRKTPVILGDYRYEEYSQYTGTLSIWNCTQMEDDERTEEEALLLEHQRALDFLTTTEMALFMEHLEPFTPALLPWLDVQAIVPIEPDERPDSERQANVAFARWRVTFEIRSNAWPAT